MRVGVALAVACLSISMLCAAEPTPAAVRRPTDIPAQSLGTALQALAKQRAFQVVYLSDAVDIMKTDGAAGDLTPDEALKQLLSGTGLTYRYLDESTVTVYPADAPRAMNGFGIQSDNPSEASVGGPGIQAQAHASSWKRLRLAQATSAENPGSTNSEVAAETSEDRKVKLDEIVVTAQKREQNLQDIPFSISAIGGQRIEQLGLQGLNDLMGMVPGVSYSAVGPGEGNLVIRGIATGEIEGSITNRKEAVGLYINDTPVGQPRFVPDISPFDLERVEVLRGPQGTLYGSGSLAGTVRYITRKPNTRELETKAGADVSSTKRGGLNHRFDAMVNLPLSDTFALRIVGYEQFDDGYIRGVGPGAFGHDENDVQEHGGRVAVRWKLTDRFAADASAMIQRLNSGDVSSQDNVGYAFSRGVPVGPYEQYRDSPTFVRNRFNLYNLTLEYDLGWGKLTSSTSLLDNENDHAEDFNASVQHFYGVDLAGRGFNFLTSRDWSQELRTTTSFEGPLNFIGGVFYTDQHRSQAGSTPVPGFDAAYTIPIFGVDSTAFGAPVDDIFRQTVHIDERQAALFGELTYAMTKKLSATAGLRWFDVKQDYFIATAGVVASGNPPLNRNSAESGFNPKFLVSYAVSDDALVSAQAARGFRLGGTNDLTPQSLCAADLAALGLTKAPETFKSENVWNYELNAKTSWLDRRLTVNGSVYHIDYKNIQVMTQISCGFPFTDNAASAKSQGFELELAARPLEGLELSIGGAYTDAELTVDVPRLGGKAGDQLPMSAKFTGNATARYEFPIVRATRGFVQYSYRYTDRISFSLNYAANPGNVAQPAPAYDLHNIRVGMKTGRWNASLYLNNVLDEKAVTYESNFFGLERLRTRGQPRTVGLNVYADF